MTGFEILVIAAAVLLTGVLGWYFFGPRKAHDARLDDGFRSFASRSRVGTALTWSE